MLSSGTAGVKEVTRAGAAAVVFAAAATAAAVTVATALKKNLANKVFGYVH